MPYTKSGNSSARKPENDSERMKRKKTKEKCGLLIATALILIGIMLLAVPGMKFSAFLTVGLAALLVVDLLLGKRSEQHRAFKVCKLIFRCIVAAVLAVLICIEGYVISCGEQVPPDQHVDAVIVLGAGVHGETPSLALQTRINAAAEYLKRQSNVPIVLSGGKGSGESITEAEAMRRALWTNSQERNEQYLLEEQSTNTAENFRYSKELLAQQGIDVETDVIAVVTNDFHLARAKVIATKQGYCKVIGVPAELPWWWLNGNYYVREAFAMVKSVIFD